MTNRESEGINTPDKVLRKESPQAPEEGKKEQTRLIQYYDAQTDTLVVVGFINNKSVAVRFQQEEGKILWAHGTIDGQDMDSEETCRIINGGRGSFMQCRDSNEAAYFFKNKFNEEMPVWRPGRDRPGPSAQTESKTPDSPIPPGAIRV
ncbi:MAG: hypothetical protein WC497_03385 [Patescibacteria group bacterium]